VAALAFPAVAQAEVVRQAVVTAQINLKYIIFFPSVRDPNLVPEAFN
jgi:hypothetical protein